MDTIGGNDETFDCDINKTEEQSQSVFQESMLEDECTTEEITRKRKRKIKTVGIKKQKIQIECSICLTNVRGKKMANPSGCKHNFCVNCLKKWAKQNFTCPFDRIKFDFINIIDKCTNEVLEKIDPKGKPYVQPIETLNAAANHVNNVVNPVNVVVNPVNVVVNPVNNVVVNPVNNVVVNHVNAFVVNRAVNNVVNPAQQNVQPLPRATPTSRELYRNGDNCFICEHSNYQNLMVECDACNHRFHVGCLPNIEEITVSHWSCFMCQTLKRPIDRFSRNGATRNIALQRYRIHQQIINNNNRTPNSNNRTPDDNSNNRAPNNNNNRIPNDNNNRTPNNNNNNRTPNNNNNNRAPNNNNNRTPNDNNRPVRPLPSGPQNIQRPQPNPQVASKPESQNLLLDILRSQNELFGSKAPSNNAPNVSNKIVTNVISHLSNPTKTNGFDARDPNSRVSLVSKVAKDILKQNRNRVTNEKAKEILKIVVPKLVKEINLSTSFDRLREIAEEKIFTWMDIL